MQNKETTIILRTFNNDDIVGQTLKALYSQTYKDFELLVVDSGSSDNTLNIVSSYEHKLIKVKSEDYHPGKVLNNAVNKANTSLIVFLNSDTVMLHKNCLETLINELKNNEVSAVYARQVARPEAKPWVRRDYEIAFPEDKDSPSWMYYSLPLSGIKKAVWEKNKFYTQAWASEDTKMGVDLLKKGYKVKYLSNVIAMHSHNYTLKQIFNRRFVEGEADSYIFSKNENMFSMIKSYIYSIINDSIYHIKVFEIKELFLSFARRFVYQYAYYKGIKNGNRRKVLDAGATYGNYQ